MLEGPSNYVVSKDLLAADSCERDDNNTTLQVNYYKKKHELEDGEESSPKKLSVDSSSSSLLIHQLGRDMSINCLIHCSRSDYGSIASLNRAFRSMISSGELYKIRRQMGIVEHWIYFSCGILEWDAYDPNSNRWMRLPAMTSIYNQCFLSSDKESLAVGTQLLVFGREIMSQVIYRYSILDNKWSIGKDLNAPRFLFGSASVGDIAIVAGGCDPGGNVLDSAELYDSETGNWVNLPRMKKARKMCSAVFMEGKFYVIGGIGAANTPLTCGEEYNLKTRTWCEIPNMHPPRQDDYSQNAEAPPLVAVVKNHLYSADHARSQVKRYDKATQSWVVVGSMPERVASTNGWGLAFKACGERLVVVGGPRSLSFGGSMVEIYSWIPDDDDDQQPAVVQWTLLARAQLGFYVLSSKRFSKQAGFELLFQHPNSLVGSDTMK